MREYLLRGVIAGLLRRASSDLQHVHSGGGVICGDAQHSCSRPYPMVRECMTHEGRWDRLRPGSDVAIAALAVIEALKATTFIRIDWLMLSSASVDRNWGSTPSTSRGTAAAAARRTYAGRLRCWPLSHHQQQGLLEARLTHAVLREAVHQAPTACQCMYSSLASIAIVRLAIVRLAVHAP